MADEAKLKKHLWDFFVIAQFDILSAAPADLKQFEEFLAGKHKKPPFVEGSASLEVCRLCGKI
ncbi:hypothetical protein D3C87_588030 [compost metagenome]